jgi:uncharacterized protein (TIGR02679 family)
MSSLPDWIASPALTDVWERIRTRVETTGLPPRGTVTLALPSRDARHAVGALLGRTITRDRVIVDLADLDTRLASRSGRPGLAAVLEALTGGPLRDRRTERTQLAQRREEPLALAESLLEAPWVETWVAGLRRTGQLTNRSSAVRLVADAAQVLRLVTSDPSPRSRVELGAQLLGDAHALDEDRPLHLVVLRGLAAASGVVLPSSPGERRALWQAHGVTPDLISSTCLTLGLRPTGDDPVSKRLRLAADAGDPVHLTAWDLRRCDLNAPTRRSVLVCENPRVIEAVAETCGSDRAVVCTSGEPNTVVATVLERIGSTARLRYHGDFDWAGIAIANRLVTRFDVSPWLMTAAHYEEGLQPGGPALSGRPVEPVWDAELGAAMRLHGVAVHEESVLVGLLAGLGEQVD